MERERGRGMGDIWGATVRGDKAMVTALVTNSFALRSIDRDR
jgi:hypothetical protein